jgi:very-short-patch-repair endonuclease
MVVGVNDLQTKDVTLSKEWHPAKNGDLLPCDVAQYSNKKVWWLGACGHEWNSHISSRAKGSGCSYCSNKEILPGFNDLESQNKTLASEWHPTKNKDLKPSQVALQSNKKVWWRCKNNPLHEWDASPNSRSTRGCPFCSNCRVATGVNDLLTTHPVLANEFHPTKNYEINLARLTASSMTKVWWLCSLGHEWFVPVRSRTLNGVTCLVCSNRKVLSGFNDLQTIAPEVALEWHPTKNPGMHPTSVLSGSLKKVWWICSNKHEYESFICVRVSGKRCPYCSNRKIALGFNDLKSLDPIVANEWNYKKNGDLLPEHFTLGSEKSVWWICTNLHEWKTAILHRTGKYGTGCPTCSQGSTSKIQQSFHKELAKVIPDLQCDVRIPVKFRKRSSMSVDMVSEALKLVIEYDGYYYHSGGRSGRSLVSHIATDTEKTQALLDAGYRVVRIREDGLPHLSMDADKVFEIDYKYGDSLDSAISMMQTWMELE